MALALFGAVGIVSSASAAELGNINPDALGTITIHKHVEDASSTDYNPAGAPLDGVQFSVTEVLFEGASVSLDTAEGWAAIDGLAAGDVPGGDFTLGASQNVTTAGGGIATTDPIGVGLYLVKEIATGPNLITQPADDFLVTIPHPTAEGWEYDVDVYPKNVLGSVTPTKTAEMPDVEADDATGLVVPFTITVPVAEQALPYETFTITDSLGAGLAFESWGDITIGAGAPLVPGTDYTMTDTTITFLAPGIAALNAATATAGITVTAEFNATVTAPGQLENTATVTINGAPGTTPPAVTNWAQLDITKTDESEQAEVLAGATFELYDAETDELLATGTTDDDGKLVFTVWVGNDATTTRDVYLVETVAPQGYVLPADPQFGPYELEAGDTVTASITYDTITNFEPEGIELPLTGAQGTMMMTFGGLFIVAMGASLLLVRRKKHVTELS